MAAIASPPDEDAVSRWDGDGGSQPLRPTAARPDAQQFLRFIRLESVAEVRDGDVSFPLGILWPYTSDLRHVRDEYDAASDGSTGALMASIATLYERIAFAPGAGGRGGADAYHEMTRLPARSAARS